MKNILRLAAILLLNVAFTLQANALSITLTGPGDSQVRSGIYTGLYALDINGEEFLAMCDDFNTHIHFGDSWMADLHTYSDINNGAAVKFSANGLENYNQIGYLFSMINPSTPTQQADIHLAIWEIMTPGSLTLTGNALSLFKDATSGTWNSFDYSQYMAVLTPNPFNASQEF